MRTFILLALLLSLSGCAKWRNGFKHFVSNVAGTARRITLYDGAGKPIRQWECDCKVEMRGGDVWFIDSHGKSVALMGSVVVEEL